MDDHIRLMLGATFDAVADGYEARPPYPDEVFTLLTERCGLGPGTRVLEIGPATGLATLAATSFHWVDPTIGLAKVAAHLRPGGWLALWWNVFGDASRPDPFERAVGVILEEHAPDLHYDAFAAGAPYALDAPARIAEIDTTEQFDPVEHRVIAWEGRHDALGIRRLFATYSPWLALPEDQRIATLDALERVAREDFADVVVRPYLTSLFLARRTAT